MAGILGIYGLIVAVIISSQIVAESYTQRSLKRTCQFSVSQHVSCKSDQSVFFAANSFPEKPSSWGLFFGAPLDPFTPPKPESWALPLVMVGPGGGQCWIFFNFEFKLKGFFHSVSASDFSLTDVFVTDLPYLFIRRLIYWLAIRCSPRFSDYCCCTMLPLTVSIVARPQVFSS